VASVASAAASAALEAADSSTRGTGSAPTCSGLGLTPWKCRELRASQGRQARPEEAQGSSSATAEGGRVERAGVRSMRARCSTSSCVLKSTPPVHSSARMQPIDQRSTLLSQLAPSVTSAVNSKW